MTTAKYHDNPINNSAFRDHYNGNVIILMKFLSLAALEVVILTTSSAASDENFVKMMTFPFQRKEYNKHGLMTLSSNRVTCWWFWARNVLCWLNLIYKIRAEQLYQQSIQLGQWETFLRILNKHVGMHTNKLLFSSLGRLECMVPHWNSSLNKILGSLLCS